MKPRSRNIYTYYIIIGLLNCNYSFLMPPPPPHTHTHTHPVYLYRYSGGKLALSLLSNTAFGQGATVISHWEESRLGLQWTNIAKPLSIIEPLNMGAIFGMMICDIVLYLLLAWYVGIMLDIPMQTTCTVFSPKGGRGAQHPPFKPCSRSTE